MLIWLGYFNSHTIIMFTLIEANNKFNRQCFWNVKQNHNIANIFKTVRDIDFLMPEPHPEGGVSLVFNILIVLVCNHRSTIK